VVTLGRARVPGDVISNIIERVPESDALYGDFDEAGQPWEKDVEEMAAGEKEKKECGGRGVSCNLAV